MFNAGSVKPLEYVAAGERVVGLTLNCSSECAAAPPSGFDRSTVPGELGKLGLAPIDATCIAPGTDIYPNRYLQLFRSTSGKLYAIGSLQSEGIFVMVEPDKNVIVSPDKAVYCGERRYDAEILQAGQKLMPGEEEKFSVHRIVGKLDHDTIYMRDDGMSAAGTYVSDGPGKFVEVKPTSRHIHLGPHGLVPIKQQGMSVKSVRRRESSPEVQDLGRLYTGGGRVHKLRSQRGLYGYVVLRPTAGGAEVEGGYVQILYRSAKEARDSAGFIAGIFRLRLGADLIDRGPELVLRTSARALLAEDDSTYFAPRIAIDGVIEGDVALDGNLFPAGLLDPRGVHLIQCH